MPQLSLPTASVVIPAHNEASVIDRCLDGVVGHRAGEFEVIVISNGSTDATEAIARARLDGTPHTFVAEIDTASKVAALRMGDELASAYPRIYLDADVVVSHQTLLGLVDALTARADPTVAAPWMVVDSSRSSWTVRAYHNVWTRLPYVENGVIGTGIYAVNAAGGAVKGRFPDLLNDDAYVRGVFPPHQRISTPGHFIVIAPRTVTALVKRRARVHLGNNDVESVVAGAGRSTGKADVVSLLRKGTVQVHEVVVYVGITIAAMVIARIRHLRGTGHQWSTDTTSRTLGEVVR